MPAVEQVCDDPSYHNPSSAKKTIQSPGCPENEDYWEGTEDHEKWNTTQ